MRYFLEISFNGQPFHGWQKQVEHNSVQQRIEQALAVILKKEVKIVGCGRTDSGVHASQFYAHFDFEHLPDKFMYQLNALVGQHISINKVFPVEPNVSARFDAYKRSYEYYFHFGKNVFSTTSYQCPYRDLNFDHIKKVTNLYTSHTDYALLSKSNPDNKSTVCLVDEAKITALGSGQYVFAVSANRFLWNMVRRMTGLLIDVGRGKISVSEIEDCLGNSKPLRLNFVAPPHALYLVWVQYPFIDNERKSPRI